MTNPISDTTICACCKKVVSLDDFYQGPQYPNGRHRWCKECCRKAARDRYQATHGNSSPRPTAPDNHKYCPHCKRTLPFDAFSHSPNGKHGLQSWCRACFHTRYVKTRDLKSVPLEKMDPYAPIL